MNTGKILRSSVTVAAIIAAAIVAVIFIRYYYTHDPSAGSGLKCIFKLLTGYDCPGCGSQRAFHAILHGNFAAAWAYNPMVFFAIPGGIYYIIVEAGRRHWPRVHAASVNPIIIIAIFVAITAFWIGRNI